MQYDAAHQRQISCFCNAARSQRQDELVRWSIILWAGAAGRRRLRVCIRDACLCSTPQSPSAPAGMRLVLERCDAWRNRWRERCMAGLPL